jgi:hypothetical protein
MQQDIFRSPQLFVLGRVSRATGFTQEGSVFLRCHFVTGDQWRLLGGSPTAESFEAVVRDGEALVEQPIDLHYCAESVRGWPRVFSEVWVRDEDGRYQLGGYGTTALPFGSGHLSLDIPCWRPKDTWADVGANPELKSWGLALSSASRFGLECRSTGTVWLELDLITKDFGIQGVKLG